MVGCGGRHHDAPILAVGWARTSRPSGRPRDSHAVGGGELDGHSEAVVRGVEAEREGRQRAGVRDEALSRVVDCGRDTRVGAAPPAYPGSPHEPVVGLRTGLRGLAARACPAAAG